VVPVGVTRARSVPSVMPNPAKTKCVQQLTVQRLLRILNLESPASVVIALAIMWVTLVMVSKEGSGVNENDLSFLILFFLFFSSFFQKKNNKNKQTKTSFYQHVQAIINNNYCCSRNYNMQI
jgi:hypothetical protein